MNGSNFRGQRAASVIAHEAAQFIAREAGGESLITVTRALPSKNGDRITVFVSVFPDGAARAALAFLERKREAFSDHLKTHARLGLLPRIEFLQEDMNENQGGPGGIRTPA